jgi:hypothetical protein
VPGRKKGSPVEEAERQKKILASYAEFNRGILVTSKVDVNTDPITFRCQKKHNFYLSLRQVKRGSWCEFCRDGIPYNQGEAIKILKQSGYDLKSQFTTLGGEVKAICLKCKDERNQPFNRLRDNPCKHKRVQAHGALEKMQAAAKKFEGTLVSKSGRYIQDEYKWECKEGHRFDRTGYDVIHRDRWCTTCEPTRVDLSRAKELVEARGGKLLTKGTIDSKTRLSIVCNLGHHFEKSWNEMSSSRAQWCDTCSSKSKSEEMARTVLEQISGLAFPKKRPVWLVYEGRRLELDGFNEQSKVAFEYQGQQHYDTKGVYGGTKEQLERRKNIDDTKRKLCTERGVYLIEIAYTVRPENFKEEILSELIRLDYPDIATFDWTVVPDLDKAFIREDRLEQLREAMASKNLKLLSKKWIDVTTKYEYECLTCGDKSQKEGRSFLKGRGPDGCKKCAMKATAQLVAERKLGLKRLSEIAQKFHAELVSTEYLTVKDQYKWICGQGHEVSRTIPDIDRSGHLCVECASTAPTLEDLKKFADDNGGRLLSETYSGVKVQYKWRCRGNHEFERTWPNMRNAKFFCHTCGEKEDALRRMGAYAKTHGGECLATEYFDVKYSYLWRCSEGHEFTKSFERMMRNKDVFHGRCS